jgi:hypothetical protein
MGRSLPGFKNSYIFKIYHAGMRTELARCFAANGLRVYDLLFIITAHLLH